MKKRENEELEKSEEIPCTTRAYFYIGVGAVVLAAVSLGLIFVEPLGIYALICSVLLSIGGLSFFTTQKKKNNFKELKIAVIAAYVVLGLAIAVLVVGTIYSAVQSKEEAEALIEIFKNI